MTLEFYKYQGTGNDFIMVDDRDGKYATINSEQIAKLCHRRFGIGADGFIFLRPSEEYDFEMVYYNSDGKESSMCGNGGRCILRFAHDLGINRENYSFMAIDGVHYGVISDNVVSLQMKDVSTIEERGEHSLFMDTGSPHHIQFMSTLPEEEFVQQAKEIRHSPQYAAEGVNVNFVSIKGKELSMRTFERGVEDETYSCGTGVTAAAIASNHKGLSKGNHLYIHTPGGKLELQFKVKDGHYSDIWLTGPAEQVFKGEISL